MIDGLASVMDTGALQALVARLGGVHKLPASLQSKVVAALNANAGAGPGGYTPNPGLIMNPPPTFWMPPDVVVERYQPVSRQEPLVVRPEKDPFQALRNKNPEEQKKRAFGARGTYSGRDFNPDLAGGPIRNLHNDKIKFTDVPNNTSNVSLVGDTSGFNALGIAVDPKASQQGRLLMQQYRQQYPDMSPAEVQRLARSTLETGDALPSVSIAKPGDTFFKLIPTTETRGPSPGTVYWMDGSQLDNLMAGRIDIGSSFGLPNQTTTSAYKVYQTSVKEAQAPLIFRSNIASVVDDGVFKVGGQSQTLLPKRSAFNEPVQILDRNGSPLIIKSR